MAKESTEMLSRAEAPPLEKLQQRLTQITNKSASCSRNGSATEMSTSVAHEDNPALLRLQNRLRFSAMNLLARREHSRLELQTKLTNKKRLHIQQAYKLILEKGEECFFPFATDVIVEPGLGAEKSNGCESSITDEASKIKDIDYVLAWLGDRFFRLLKSVLTQLEVDGLLDDQRFAESYLRSRSRAGFGPTRISSELKQRGVAITSNQMHAIDWFELIVEVRSKKFGVALPNDLKGKAKQIQFLSYRGFPKDLIDEVFNIKNN